MCVLRAVENALLKARVSDRKSIASYLKRIYRAESIEQAKDWLTLFRKKWASKYSKLASWWEDHFEDLTHFLTFPQEIRSMIYTTNQL